MKKPQPWGRGVHAKQRARRQLESPPLPSFPEPGWKTHPCTLLNPAGTGERQSTRAGQEAGGATASPPDPSRLVSRGSRHRAAAVFPSHPPSEQCSHMPAPSQHTQLAAPIPPPPWALRQETRLSVGSRGHRSPLLRWLSPLGKGHATPTAALQWADGGTGLQPWEGKTHIFTGAGHHSGQGVPYSHSTSSRAGAPSASSPGWLLAPQLHADT